MDKTTADITSRACSLIDTMLERGARLYMAKDAPRRLIIGDLRKNEPELIIMLGLPPWSASLYYLADSPESGHPIGIRLPARLAWRLHRIANAWRRNKIAETRATIAKHRANHWNIRANYIDKAAALLK